jgi:hypothetical protein
VRTKFVGMMAKLTRLGLTATTRFLDRVFLEIEFRGTQGARAEAHCETDKISVGNGQIYVSQDSLERGEKGQPEYAANSFLDPLGWGRVLFVPVVFCCISAYIMYGHVWPPLIDAQVTLNMTDG